MEIRESLSSKRELSLLDNIKSSEGIARGGGGGGA
jgi:hypothetical protein